MEFVEKRQSHAHRKLEKQCLIEQEHKGQPGEWAPRLAESRYTGTPLV